MYRVSAALLLSALAAVPLGAQSAVLKAPGKTIEVVGLQRWTVAMVEDSLAKYAPGTPLTSHSCASKLRYAVGFADAANFTIHTPGDSLTRVVVVVVEPQDSARVKYRHLPIIDGGPLRPEWSDATEVLKTRTAVFFEVANSYLDRTKSAETIHRDSVAAGRLRAFLRSHRSQRDADLARQVLLHDPNVHNRSVAALMLLNFPQDDRTWWALVEAMRESDGLARNTAGTVLGQLVRHAPRPVNWMPARDAIHAMLDGTSVFQLPNLLSALLATGVGEESATAFVGGGGRMLISYAAAQHPMLHIPARELLKALSGKDHGSDIERWGSWMSAMQAPG